MPKPTPQASPLEIKVDENGKYHLFAGGVKVLGVMNIKMDQDFRELGSSVTIQFSTRAIRLGTLPNEPEESSDI